LHQTIKQEGNMIWKGMWLAVIWTLWNQKNLVARLV